MIDGLTGLSTTSASGRGALFNEDTARLKADVTASTPLPITIDPTDDVMRGFIRFSNDMTQNIRASENPTITDLINADGNLRSIVPNGFILLANKLDALIQKSNSSLSTGGGGGLFPLGGGGSSGEVVETEPSPWKDVTSGAISMAVGTSIAQAVGPSIAQLVGTISGAVVAIELGTAGMSLLAKGVDTVAQKVMSEEKYKEMLDVQTEALEQGYLEAGGYDGATVSGPQWFTDWVAKSDAKFQEFSLEIQSTIASAFNKVKNTVVDAWNTPLEIPEEPDPQVVVPEAVVDFAHGVEEAIESSVPSGSTEAFNQGYVEFGDGTNDKGMAWLKGLFHKEEKLAESMDNLAVALNANTGATEVQTEVTAIQTEASFKDPFSSSYTQMSAEEALQQKLANGKGNGGISVNVNNMNPSLLPQMSNGARMANPYVGGNQQQLYTNSGIGWTPISAGSIMPYTSVAPVSIAM